MTESREASRDTPTRPRTRTSGRTRRPRRTNIVTRHPVLWSSAAIALVVGLVAAAWFTPVLSVRTIEVSGLDAVPEQQVLDALAIAEGTPLMRLDTTGAAARVAGIPKVAQVRVQRMYPSTVRVTVTERTAVAFVDTPTGTHLLDAEGVDYAAEPPPMGVPRLVTEHPGAGDEPTAAAITVLAALPAPLRGQLREISATSISDITLTLHDDRQILWGTSAESDRKAAVVLPLLTQPGRLYTVSSPGLVSVR